MPSRSKPAGWPARPTAPSSSPWATPPCSSRPWAAAKRVPGKDFFPLTVNYIEKTYAAGRIPGGFFKREGRPTEKETLTSRLIDRPIRPLFPENFFNEVQVVATVVSLDPEIDSDIPALIGASAALALSGIPFKGPIGAAKVGYRDGKYILNPTTTRPADVGARARRCRHGRCRADGRVRSQAAVRRRDARRRRVRSRTDAGRDQGDQRTRRQGRQAGLGLEGAARRRRPCRRRRRACRSELGKAYSIIEKQARHTRVGEIKKAAGRSSRRRRSAEVRRRARCPTSSACSNTTSCVAASSRASRASTAATCTPCARSASRPACCRARTVRRCSRVAKRRRSSRRRSAPAVTRRSSTRSQASAKSRSCCTTTSRRSRWARPA